MEQKNLGSYVEWSTIFAGTALACAISIVFLQFGTSLGLTIRDTLRYDGEYPQWRIVIVGMWLFWVQLIASISGAYITGRMRRPIPDANSHESEIRDGTHGLLVWATSTVVAVAAAAISTFLTALAASHTAVDNPPQISADLTRRFTILLGFGMAAGSLVSALAAWGMGTVGGDHRDKAVDLSQYISFRRR